MKTKENKNNTPKLSIISVAFNAYEDLEKTIQNISSLDYPNIEYIIIDGRSNDGTIELLKKHKSVIDKAVSEPDKGIYDAMNKGIKESTGDWLNFMNAGDLFYDSNVLANIDFKNFSDSAVLYGDTFRRPTQKITKPRSIEHIATTGHVMACHQSMFFNKNVIGEDLFYDDTLDYSGDSELITRLYVKNLKFTYLNLVIADYMGGGVTSGGNIPVMKLFKARIDYFKYTYKLLGLKKSLFLSVKFIWNVISSAKI